MKKMLQLCVAAAYACLIANCSTALTPAQKASFKDKLIVTAKRLPEDRKSVQVITVADALAAGLSSVAVGVAAGASNPNGFNQGMMTGLTVSQYGSSRNVGSAQDSDEEDPALQIAHSLAETLASHTGARFDKADPRYTKGTFVSRVTKSYPGSDLILDVTTTDWMTLYFPLTWNRYRVVYGAGFRLIDAKTGKVLAQASYRGVPEKTSDAPTMEELRANNNARFKLEMKKHIDACVKQFRVETLKL